MKSTQLLQLGFIALAGTFVYSFVSAARDGERRQACTATCALRPDYAGFNRTAPDFELPTLNGGRFRLSEQRGKVVVLSFWTKSCRPCLQEMPNVAEFAKIIASSGKDIELVTVSTDESAADAEATLKSVLEGEDLPFIALIDTENKVVRGQYGTKLYPETWFIDAEGVIRARFDGPRDWDDPLYLDLAKNLLAKSSCLAEFEQGKTRGATSTLCADLPLAVGL